MVPVFKICYMKYFLVQSFVKQHLYRLMLVVFTGLVHNLSSIVLLLATGKYIEIVFSISGSKSRTLGWLGIHPSGELVSFFVFFFLVVLLKFASSWAEKYLTSMLSAQFAAKARKDYFSYLLQETDPAFQKPVSKNLVWFSGELKALQRYMEKGIIGLVRDVLFLIICFYLLFRFHLTLGITILLIAAAIFIITRYATKRLKNLTRQNRNRFAGLLSFISLRLHSLDTIQQKGDAERTHARLVKKQQQILADGKPYQLYRALLYAMIPFLLFCMLGILMIMIAANGAAVIPAADAVGFVLLLLNLFSPISRVVKIETVLMPGRMSLEKLEQAYNRMFNAPAVKKENNLTEASSVSTKSFT